MNKPLFLETRVTCAANGVAAAFAAASVDSKELTEYTGLLDYLAAGADTQFASDLGIKWGGWLNAGVTYNADHATGRFNGTVTFGDQANAFQVNQFYLYMQRPVDTEGAD